ncbi:MAG: hypothetical protein DWQ19_12885 [Crenarchaeota archaeon]|nr:MAG: hypothetical protein DWQ19_12885 [Thermoproteota archaeon]
MHCLEVIVARNNKAQAEQVGRPPATGWEVRQTFPGIIHVFNHLTGENLTVDASNPHDEQSLLDFHRNWQGAPSIAHQVEQIASQHRRMNTTARQAA